MSVTVDPAIVHLVGPCPVEDAEALLLALQQAPARAVDLSRATGLHLAVAQILAIARPAIIAGPEDAFLRDRLLPALLQPDRPQTN